MVMINEEGNIHRRMEITVVRLTVSLKFTKPQNPS